MKLFTIENTEGYTQAELDALNAEWQHRVDTCGWDKDSAEYQQQQKWFSDEVAGR